MDQIDFTRGSITKSFCRFFFPMLLANILQQVYSFTDMVIIGQGLGDRSLAAVGNFTTISFFLTGFIMGITNGFSVNISQACGEKESGKLKKIIASSLKITAVFAVLFSMIGLLLLKPMLQIMQTDQELLNDCMAYGCIIFGGLPILAAYQLLSSVLRGVGDSKTPLFAIGVSSACNIILDILFLYLFHSGISGPAYATVLSQLLAAGICYFRLHRMKERKITRSDFVIHFRLDMELLKNGLPMAFMHAMTSVGCIFVQSCINGYGVAYTSAYAVCNKYLNFFMLPGITIGFTISSFTGQNFGGKEFKRIRGGTKMACIMAVLSALLLGMVLFFFSDLLAKIMLTGQEVAACASIYLRFLALFMVLLNALFVFRSCVQGLGKPAVPMCSGIVEMLIRIPAVYFGLPVFGFAAAIYAEGIAWIGALALNGISYICFLKKYERHGC